jgi:hypothetical protein
VAFNNKKAGVKHCRLSGISTFHALKTILFAARGPPGKLQCYVAPENKKSRYNNEKYPNMSCDRSNKILGLPVSGEIFYVNSLLQEIIYRIDVNEI